MKEIALNAYAKINLSIDILGKRPDGYHEVLMVMQQVDLYDIVNVRWLETGAGLKTIEIKLSTNRSDLPNDHSNIAYKAAALMAETYGRDRRGRIEIEIEKQIPIAAGLAGGSANGAAVLHAMNRLWDLQLDVNTLMELGKRLGADVSFCISGQAALNENLGLKKDLMAGTCAVASGIGEKLRIIKPLHAWILLSKPPISVSTAQVYGGLRLNEITEHPDTDEMVAGINENNYYKIAKNMINLLENYSLKEYPVIMYTKNKIAEESKPYKVLMSGSGPTVFGLFTSRRNGCIAFNKLKHLNKETFFVKTL